MTGMVVHQEEKLIEVVKVLELHIHGIRANTIVKYIEQRASIIIDGDREILLE